MFVAKSAPPVSVTPFEDASPPVETPPVKVEVAEVVAEINGTINPVYIVEVGAWKFPTDWTDRIEPGVVVPMPRLPALVSRIFSRVLALNARSLPEFVPYTPTR